MWNMLKRITSCKWNNQQKEEESKRMVYSDKTIYSSTGHHELDQKTSEKKCEDGMYKKRKSKGADGFREIFANFNPNCQKYG